MIIIIIITCTCNMALQQAHLAPYIGSSDCLSFVSQAFLFMCMTYAHIMWLSSKHTLYSIWMTIVFFVNCLAGSERTSLDVRSNAGILLWRIYTSPNDSHKTKIRRIMGSCTIGANTRMSKSFERTWGSSGVYRTANICLWTQGVCRTIFKEIS